MFVAPPYQVNQTDLQRRLAQCSCQSRSYGTSVIHRRVAGTTLVASDKLPGKTLHTGLVSWRCIRLRPSIEKPSFSRESSPLFADADYSLL
jgi:hypothetical protein